MASKVESCRILNVRDAWKRIEQALEDPQIPRDNPRCGTPEQIHTDIKKSHHQLP